MNPPRAALVRAAAVIRRGGVVAWPAEACYGLGCDPLNRAALRRILRIKGRPAAAGLIVVAADFAQLAPLLAPLPAAVKKKVTAAWPGPETWLLPARANVPRLLRGRHKTLAVRVTAHPPAAALCRQAGTALVSTSANRHGRRPLGAAIAVRRGFGRNVDFVVPGRTAGLARVTRIRDGASGAVLRA
ncbi:MAG: L-threonylcarbamoyladenylate synthase [Gammaproteobacteria bacterium]|nr:L-threonylcarbamoyladenylate synthase [Gammaproteobacteria bacterium]MDD9871726.1 L-threonylcarbamoyladenylate synthase [Gammaproteobacteria bacterium]